MKNEFDEILAYLDYIRSQNRLVSVVNTFMGVSYTLNVNVNKISRTENTLTVATQPPQKLSLLPNIWVTIHCDLFPFPVKAKVLQVDNTHNTSILGYFEYERTLDENRSQPRYLTRTEHTVQIDLVNSDRVYGLINDISTDGISVILQQPEGMDIGMMTGSSCRLTFSFQVKKGTAPHSFETSAEIVYSNPIDDGFYRIGMKIFPTHSDQSLIRRYIFDRQTEIFKEVGPSHIVN